MPEIQIRRYPANRQRDFDRDRAELEADGWVVQDIEYREEKEKPGCSFPLVGVMMYRPSQTMMVTYRKASH
jgi:hypothetical protein